MVIGIDTIRFHKSFHPEIVKELIRPKLGRDKNGLQWFHGLLTFTNKPDNNHFSSQVSFSKLLHGNNLISSTPETIKEGITIFERMTKLNVKDADISRVDMALNMEVDGNMTRYFDLLKEHRGYEVGDRFDCSRYLYDHGDRKALALYNKNQEMASKGIVPLVVFVDYNIPTLGQLVYIGGVINRHRFALLYRRLHRLALDLSLAARTNWYR